MEEGLGLKFWGTRGSMAAPFSNRMVYGGNTSSVSVQWPEGMAVFDGGTGILALGQHLEEAAARGQWDQTRKLHIFVSHVHLDHIMGLPLFPPLFWKAADMEFFGPGEGENSFRQRLGKVIGPPCWPISLEQVSAKIQWHDTRDGDVWSLPGEVKVRVMGSRHPDGTVIYRLDQKGSSVVYGLDCEPGEESGRMWEKYRQFAGNCGLLIFDAPYDEKEYCHFKGFGHGFWQQGLDMAVQCGAKKLCISHHNWKKTDEQLGEMEREAAKEAENRGVSLAFAREGMELTV